MSKSRQKSKTKSSWPWSRLYADDEEAFEFSSPNRRPKRDVVLRAQVKYDVVVRRAALKSQNDWKYIVALIKEFGEKGRKWCNGKEGDKLVNYVSDVYLESGGEYETSDLVVYVAYDVSDKNKNDETEPVGFALMAKKFDYPEPEKKIYEGKFYIKGKAEPDVTTFSELLALCVNPEKRGRKIGQLLLANVISDARREGIITDVALNASGKEPSTAARRLYESFGMEPADVRNKLNKSKKESQWKDSYGIAPFFMYRQGLPTANDLARILNVPTQQQLQQGDERKVENEQRRAKVIEALREEEKKAKERAFQRKLAAEGREFEAEIKADVLRQKMEDEARRAVAEQEEDDIVYDLADDVNEVDEATERAANALERDRRLINANLKKFDSLLDIYDSTLEKVKDQVLVIEQLLKNNDKTSALEAYNNGVELVEKINQIETQLPKILEEAQRLANSAGIDIRDRRSKIGKRYKSLSRSAEETQASLEQFLPRIEANNVDEIDNVDGGFDIDGGLDVDDGLDIQEENLGDELEFKNIAFDMEKEAGTLLSEALGKLKAARREIATFDKYWQKNNIEKAEQSVQKAIELQEESKINTESAYDAANKAFEAYQEFLNAAQLMKIKNTFEDGFENFKTKYEEVEGLIEKAKRKVEKANGPNAESEADKAEEAAIRAEEGDNQSSTPEGYVRVKALEGGSNLKKIKKPKPPGGIVRISNKASPKSKSKSKSSSSSSATDSASSPKSRSKSKRRSKEEVSEAKRKRLYNKDGELKKYCGLKDPPPDGREVGTPQECFKIGLGAGFAASRSKQ